MECEMEYPAITMKDAATELDRLHSQIENKLRSTVQDAIRAGEILTQVKERLGHGEFLPWLNSSCSFSQRTAYNYLSVYSHSDKIATVANLQEAYRQIDTIERQEKQTEEQKAYQRVKECIRTGSKPDGWRRGTDDKLLKEEEDRTQRIEDYKLKMKQAEEEREKRDQEFKQRQASSKEESDFLNQVAERFIEESKKRKSFKERIKLSQAGNSDLFIDALMDYLNELPDDNRRIESCQNIIKVCKNIAVELQRGGQ